MDGAAGFRQTAIYENLRLRSDILLAIRMFFHSRDYLEIETPVRIPANAPESYIAPVESENYFLQTSPEVCMKRLLAAGFSRIFQICPCFRKKERGKKHLPEMTLLEWYQANTGYRFMMEFTELLVCHIAKRTGKGDNILYRGKRIDLRPPWRQMTVSGAFEEFSKTGCREAIEKGRYDEIMAFEIEPRLGWEKPVFLYDYPREKAALSRLKPGNPSVAERFELYIGGLELCNAFSELTDPVQQKKRFEAERKQGNRELPLPEKFLEAMPRMPEASGNALGVDRLVMLFAGADRIDDVVAFVPEEL